MQSRLFSLLALTVIFTVYVQSSSVVTITPATPDSAVSVEFKLTEKHEVLNGGYSRVTADFQKGSLFLYEFAPGSSVDDSRKSLTTACVASIKLAGASTAYTQPEAGTLTWDLNSSHSLDATAADTDEYEQTVSCSNVRTGRYGSSWEDLQLSVAQTGEGVAESKYSAPLLSTEPSAVPQPAMCSARRMFDGEQCTAVPAETFAVPPKNAAITAEMKQMSVAFGTSVVEILYPNSMCKLRATWPLSRPIHAFERLEIVPSIPVKFSVGGSTRCEVNLTNGTVLNTDTVVRDNTMSVVFKDVVAAYSAADITAHGWPKVMQNAQPVSVQPEVLTVTCKNLQIDNDQSVTNVFITMQLKDATHVVHSVGKAHAGTVSAPIPAAATLLDGFAVTRYAAVGSGIIEPNMTISNISADETTRTRLAIGFTVSPVGFFPKPGEKLVIMVPSMYFTSDGLNRPLCVGPQISYTAHFQNATAELKALVIAFPIWSILPSGGTINCLGFEARAQTTQAITSLPMPAMTIFVTPPQVFLLNVDHGIIRSTAIVPEDLALLPDTQIYEPATYAAVLMHPATNTLTQTWVYLPTAGSFTYEYKLNFTNPSPDGVTCFYKNDILHLTATDKYHTLTFTNAVAQANTEGVVQHCTSQLPHLAVELDNTPVRIQNVVDTGFRATYDGPVFPAAMSIFTITLPETAVYLPSGGSISVLLNMPWRANELQCTLFAESTEVPSTLTVSSGLLRVTYSTSQHLLARSHEQNPFHFHDNGTKLSTSPSYFNTAKLQCSHRAPRQLQPLTGMVVVHDNNSVVLKGSITLASEHSSENAPVLADLAWDAAVTCGDCKLGSETNAFELKVDVPVMIEQGDLLRIEMPENFYNSFTDCKLAVGTNSYQIETIGTTRMFVLDSVRQAVPAVTQEVTVNGNNFLVPRSQWSITCSKAFVPLFSPPTTPLLTITIWDFSVNIVYQSSNKVLSTETPYTHISKGYAFADNTLIMQSIMPTALSTAAVPYMSLQFTFSSALSALNLRCFTLLGAVPQMDLDGGSLSVRVANVYPLGGVIDVVCLGQTAPPSPSATVAQRACSDATSCSLQSNSQADVNIGVLLTASSAKVGTDKTSTATDVVVTVPHSALPSVNAIDLVLPLGYSIDAPMTPTSTPSPASSAMELQNEYPVSTMQASTTSTTATSNTDVIYTVTGMNCQPSPTSAISAFKQNGQWVLRWPISGLSSNNQYSCDRVLSPAVSTNAAGSGTVNVYMHDPSLSFSRPAQSYKYSTSPFVAADYLASDMNASTSTDAQFIDQATTLYVLTKQPGAIEPEDKVIITMSPGYVGSASTVCALQFMNYQSDPADWSNVTVSAVVTNSNVITLTSAENLEAQVDTRVVCTGVENPSEPVAASATGAFEVLHPLGRKFNVVQIEYPATTGGQSLGALTVTFQYHPLTFALTATSVIPQINVRLPADGELHLNVPLDVTTTADCSCMLSVDGQVISASLTVTGPQSLALTVPSGIPRDSAVELVCSGFEYDLEETYPDTATEVQLITMSSTATLLTDTRATPEVSAEEVLEDPGDGYSRVLNRVFLDRTVFLNAEEMAVYEKLYEAHLTRPNDDPRALTAIAARVDVLDAERMPNWAGKLNVTILIASKTLPVAELLSRVNELAEDIVSRRIIAHRVLGITRGMLSPYRAQCFNNIKDFKETDVNCGGSECPQCRDQKMCTAVDDCTSHVCVYSKCNPIAIPESNSGPNSYISWFVQLVVAITVLIPSVIYVVGVNR